MPRIAWGTLVVGILIGWLVIPNVLSGFGTFGQRPGAR